MYGCSGHDDDDDDDDHGYISGDDDRVALPLPPPVTRYHIGGSRGQEPGLKPPRPRERVCEEGRSDAAYEFEAGMEGEWLREEGGAHVCEFSYFATRRA